MSAHPLPATARCLVAACTLAAAATAQQWRLAESGGPGSDRGGLAYDAARGQLMRFGGHANRTGFSAHDRTLLFDGARWNEQPVAGPVLGFQDDVLLTYDSLRRRVVLLDDASSSIWEWDGSSWNRFPFARGTVHPVGPLTFTFDPGRNRIVATDAINTHEWNGATWQFVPSSPVITAAAFLPLRGRIVGVAGANLWEWNGATWTMIASNLLPTAPGGSYYTAAWDSWRQRFILYDTNTLPAVVHEWDGVQLTSVTPATKPRPRTRARLCFDEGAGVAVLCGGNSEYVGNSDTWAWDGQDWRELAVAPQAGSSAVAYDLVRNRLVAITSRTDQGFVRGTWERNPGNWQSRAVASPLPGPIAYDLLRQRTVLLTAVDSTTWSWDGAAWNIVAAAGVRPPARTDSAMAFDVARGELVLFGGLGNSGPVNDTWLWNGQTWRQAQTLAAPPAQFGHAMAYDLGAANIVMFGALGQTWTWDGTSWSPRFPATQPPTRIRAAMAYDASRGVVSMTGGLAIGPAANLPLDLWDWTGVDWQQTSIVGAPRLNGHGMVYDWLRGRLVVIGGRDLDANGIPSVLSSDTWELVAAPAAAAPGNPGCNPGITDAPHLDAASVPWLANDAFALRLRSGPASALAVFGLDPRPPLATPMPLGNGCSVHLASPAELRLFLTSPGGSATASLPVPNAIVLLGLGVSTQALTLDTTSTLRTSNVVLLTVGR